MVQKSGPRDLGPVHHHGADATNRRACIQGAVLEVVVVHGLCSRRELHLVEPECTDSPGLRRLRDSPMPGYEVPAPIGLGLAPNARPTTPRLPLAAMPVDKSIVTRVQAPGDETRHRTWHRNVSVLASAKVPSSPMPSTAASPINGSLFRPSTTLAPMHGSASWGCVHAAGGAAHSLLGASLTNDAPMASALRHPSTTETSP
jgi:hypothetical protein